MIRKIISISIVFIGLQYAIGQQQPIFNTALLNPYIENASLAGENNFSQGFLHYKKQWVDIEGAPESSLFTIDSPLKNEKSGLGLTVSYDKVNIIGTTGIMTTYSHSFNIDTDQKIRLGLGLRVNHNTIYFDKVNAEEEYEATLFNNFESATGFNANFGAQYNWQNLKVGLSGLNLLSSKIQYSNTTDNKELYFQYIPQLLFSVNYDFILENEISVRPELAIRNIQGMPVQLEASVFATYQKKYNAGIAYRNKNSVAFMMSALIYDRFTVGYAYQAAFGKLAGYNGGTHELVFGYRFYTAHFQEYKPVDDKKIDELIDFAQKQVDENKELQKKNETLMQEQDNLRDELDKEKNEIAQLKEIMLSQQESFNRAKEEDETELEDIPEDMFKSPDEPIYIILGVFKDTYSANKFRQVLLREADVKTEVLKRKNNQDYIVCINRKFQSEKDLQREMTRMKRIAKQYNSDAWLYVLD